MSLNTISPVSEQQEVARRFLIENQIEAVRVEWPDLHGVSRGKLLTPAHFLDAIESGTSFSTAALQMDLQGGAHAMPGQVDPHAWGSMLAAPDPSTLQPYFSQPH